MTALTIPAIGAAGGPGGYSDQVDAVLQSVGSPLPYLVKSIDGGTTDDYANLAAAVAALTGTGGDIIVVGKLRLSADPNVPKNVTVHWGIGGAFKPDAGITAHINSWFEAPKGQAIFDLSASGSAIIAPLISDFYARWFGAKGDDTAGDESANNAAIAQMLATVKGSGSNANAWTGPGVFRVSQSFAWGGVNQGFTFMGTPWSTRAQGSARANAVLKWVGSDASASLLKPDGYAKTGNFVFWAFGALGNFIEIQAAGEEAQIPGCSWVVPGGGGVAPSNACIRFLNGNYSKVDDFVCEVAPFLDIVGVQTDPSPHITTLVIDNGVIDPVAGAGPAIKVSCAVNELEIRHGVQFNAETACPKFLDNVASSHSISQLYLHAQFDANDQTLTGPIITLNHVRALHLEDVDIHGYPQLSDAFCVITDSHAFVGGVTGDSIGSQIIRSTDAASSITLTRRNDLKTTTCPHGVYDGTNSSASTGTYIPVSVGAEATGIAKVHMEQGDPSTQTEYDVKVTNASNFQVNLATSGDSDGHPGQQVWSQQFWVTISNNSGGAMGTVTWSSQFTLKSAQPASPANTQSYSILFKWNGTKAKEITRTATG